MSAPSLDGTEAPLEQIERWGAGFAAAAVVDARGALHTAGDQDRVVRIASITKLCTAWAVLIAVEEGAMGLDDPLGPPGATVRHLLCHAGGLDFDTDAVLAPPGRRRIYSNTGYDLLAGHVEATTELRFADYLAEAVLAPLGMTSSELRGSAAKDLWSDVTDLVRFAEELAHPRLVHDDTARAARTAQFPDLAGVLPGWGPQDPCSWGLGPELRGTKTPHWTGATASAATFGHFGGSGTLLWLDPVAQVRCIVLTDREFGDWAVRDWPPFSDSVRSAYC